jgi:hypothetical protein
MGKPRTSHQATKTCPHLDTTVTLNHGIERVACKACGHVSLEHFEDAVGEYTVITSFGLISRVG